ncbi:hypothetical protein [Aquisphaera insulae]|uniref:hypothetical protein n=1 Tax=Aquisphaera insulae TaxID=2712864 RepID=UPI0013EAFF3F|nr:hypothetical protein [Aquisphaera insulae]
MTDEGRETNRACLTTGATARIGLIVSLLVLGVPVYGQVKVAGRDQGFVPYSEEPIRYLNDRVDDPVARLQERIDRGQASLRHDDRHGYLESVLKLLDVPASSQTLVFSKTSFQYRKIAPASPRALYFNDNVYVGWVRDGHSLEIASFDANQGAIFYLLDQARSDQPAFVRAALDCTQCHVAAGTRGVPGVLVRSIFARPSGSQATGSESFITGHESPLRERFGGWYVTGTHGGREHMGNAFVRDPSKPEELDRRAGANVVDLSGRFDATPYLSGHSDIVAHLVLAHQTQMHNLITLTNFQTRLALHAHARSGARPDAPLSSSLREQFEKPAEELVRYLLFADEVTLDAPVTGTTTFAREFASRGPRDAKGRSLREFDLDRRLFRYPCSYLIYSDAFDALPSLARDHVYRRLLDVLTGGPQAGRGFDRLSAADRRAILEILAATKSNLPEAWKQAASETAASPGPNRSGGPSQTAARSSPYPCPCP